MKFEDIPRFTRPGSYQVNMLLHHIPEWIERHEEELGLQLNPDFQRGHVWTREQQIKYIEFILRGGKSARTIYFNHPGWLSNWKGDFVCVDGLQRLTAVMKFINNEISAFGTFYNEFEDKIPLYITLVFNVNNLQTRKEVLQWYIELNTGGTIHTEEEINKVRELLGKEEDGGKS